MKDTPRPRRVETLQEYMARCQLERKKRQVDMPSWVPPEVRSYVRWIEGQSLPPMVADDKTVRQLGAVQRLAIAPKMQHVWKELKRYPAPDEPLRQFLTCACDAASDPPKLRTEKERAEAVTMLRTTAVVCALEHGQMIAEAEKAQPFLSQPGERAKQRDRHQLAAALALVAKHFDTAAENTLKLQSPLFIKHRIRDEEARAFVRLLGDETKRLFGNTLYRTVATVATIALQRPLDWRQVRKWCDRSNKSPSARSDRAK